MKGMIHIYEGNGKGKSTAAAGLAVRCAGCGYFVVYSQFLKDGTSGEIKILKEIDNIKVMICDTRFGFTFQMNEETKQKAEKAYQQLFLDVTKTAIKQRSRLLILDEVLDVINSGLLKENIVIDFLKGKPEELEVVLTGRNPSEALKELADYITRMEKVKHPFEQGIPARKGIEM